MSDIEPRAYRPDVAYPAELLQEHAHFSSGVNTDGEITGLALAARNFGITATTTTKRVRVALERCSFNGGSKLFVDSSAFSEVKFKPTLHVVKEITHTAWLKRLELYAWAAATYRVRAYLTAPDRVGCQKTTLERLSRYAPQMAACATHRAHIIVPVQKGALPMSEMYRQACAVLGLREMPIAGIPMKKDATSLEDLAELAASLSWFDARVHLLGIGPASKGFKAVIATIKRHNPNCSITSDSVDIRRLAGRRNGRGYGPRPYTAAQDRARAFVTTPHDVKALALLDLGLKNIAAEHKRAAALGWFDVELADHPTT